MTKNYRDIIDGLNDGTISKISFLIKNYSHYQQCTIFRVIDTLPSKKNIVRVVVNPTVDNSEMISFYKTFKEDYKMFDLGTMGKFTLKQLWDDIEILNIEYISL